MGESSYVTGIDIQRDRSQRLLGLSQKDYIEIILGRFEMKNCSSIVSPIIKSDKFSLNQYPQYALEKEQMKDIPYASLVGSLMYAHVCTRPDIAFAVEMLGRYQSNPGLDHWKAGKRVLRYFQGTKDFKLTYNSLEVIGYLDFDLGGCKNTGKSTSGYIFLLTGGVVSWRSVKQTIVATSTTEAEFIACYEATSQVLWLKNFISGLRIVDSISRSLRILCDTSAAVFFSKNYKVVAEASTST
ncbi:secreted RxLR effector protein 161-like [Nicotiana tabacum]|uniref:Secreted RxLR effector protein 161-like n=1 Tax=Nicotiana tabacum TaxID=4097 RepID=A0AC58S4B9_TOBAC